MLNQKKLFLIVMLFMLLSTQLHAVGELIEGGGNENGVVDKSKWSFYGQIYGQQSRTYNSQNFIYSTPKDVGSGMYQSFVTEIGKTYRVTAILIGSDTNRLEQFNGESYLTVSSATPTQNGATIFSESQRVTGGTEVTVDFTFDAISTTTYLALRSDAQWHYASARAISIKAVIIPSTNGNELINGGGNDNGVVDKAEWSFYGQIYGQQSRTYNSQNFIYSTPKDVGSGMYQSFVTEIGKTYRVTAILIGSDTNRLEQFNGESYLTVSSATPTQNGATIFSESQRVTGGTEVTVDFTFDAISTTTYLALRSDAQWHYASARAISVKEVGGSGTTPNNNCVALVPSAPIVVTQDNVVIENKIFTNISGTAIDIRHHNNITIKNCLFINCHIAIYIYDVNNITVSSNRVENGFTFFSTDSSSNVHVLKNEGLNIGHTSSGLANFVGFNKVTHGSIKDNRVENTLGQSPNVEDIISIYKSHGTSANPILIENNWLRGRGISHSGSCIMLGDNGSSHTIAQNNKGVNCGQVAAGIAGGSYNELRNNSFIHESGLPYYSSQGLYFGAYDGYGGNNNIVADNKISWWSTTSNIYFGSAYTVATQALLAISFYNNIGLGWNNYDTSLNTSILPTNLFSGNDIGYFSTKYNNGTCR